MAIENKIEAVQKVTEALKTDHRPMDDVERLSANKEHFQSLLDSPTNQKNFQKVDGVYQAEEVTELEKNPTLGQDNVSTNKSGSSTDQDRKRKQQTDEIEGVGEVKTKKAKSSSLSGLGDEVKHLNTRVSKASRLSPEELKNQAKEIIAQIENVKTQLSKASTGVKPSYQNVLSNRLSHIDDSLRIALSKAGVEYQPPVAETSTTTSPAGRFINMLTNGQHQLESLTQSLNQLDSTKLNPANLLAIQIKVGYAQQQIELFTSLLNKALESTKTIMNVQV